MHVCMYVSGKGVWYIPDLQDGLDLVKALDPYNESAVKLTPCEYHAMLGCYCIVPLVWHIQGGRGELRIYISRGGNAKLLTIIKFLQV